MYFLILAHNLILLKNNEYEEIDQVTHNERRLVDFEKISYIPKSNEFQIRMATCIKIYLRIRRIQRLVSILRRICLIYRNHQFP